MTDIYNPGQAQALFPYWPADAETFIVGGPGSGDEAQTVKKNFPSVKCIGFEANEELFNLQVKHRQFPGSLFRNALWHTETILELQSAGLSSSVCRPGMTGCPIEKVKATTLDNMNALMGPWKKIVLWLDIEYAEFNALRGAERLLTSGEVLLMNLEIWDRGKGVEGDTYSDIVPYLKEFGFKLIKQWSFSIPGKFDGIFALER